MSVREFAKKKERGQSYESIKAFLESNSIAFRETDDHYQVNCIICDETRERLGIVKDGQEDVGKWHCFNCKNRGTTLKTLVYAYDHKGVVNQKKIKDESKAERKKSTVAPELHIRMHKMAVAKKQSLLTWAYLTQTRGITAEAITHFQLGSRSVFKTSLGEDKECHEHVAIPYLVDGKCVNLKYRSLDPEVDKKWKWRREKGGETALFNHDVIYDLDYDTLIICESELDCISLWCLGFKNVVGMTAGADAFQDIWVEQLQRYKKFYLVLDRDEAGQDGAHKIGKRLGLDKCYNVVLPEDVKDPNDFLLKYDRAAFETLLKSGSQFEVPNVISLKTGINELLKKMRGGASDDVVGFDTPWKYVNEKLGPVKPGHLVILAARPKTGKSTLALNWMKYLAHQGVPVGMYTCEMKITDICWRLAQMVVPTLPRLQEDAHPCDVLEAGIVLPMNKMHFYYPQIGDLENDKVEEKIREMVQRYGIKVFIFDNLHFLCRGDDEKAMLDKTSQMFKILAENLGIVIVAVTHPRKGGDNKNITNDDLKGSSSIFQDADAVLLLNRRLDIEDDINEEQAELALSRTMIQITARFSSGGRATLAFNGRQGLFTDKGYLFTRVKNFMKETGSFNKKGKK
jgi:KaiC/GvpD/RAD55 family RecA-like ATPase